MGILDILLGGGAARGGDRGGSASGGGMTKIGMALIAYMLWRWYQNRAGGGAEPSPMPMPSPRGGGARIPQDEPPAQFPRSDPIPSPRSGSPDDNDFGPLIESTRRMPEAPRGGGRRDRPMDDEEMDEGGMDGGRSGGGGLGDILNDILNGGRGMPGSDPRGGPGGGFPRGEPGGGLPRGGRGGGLEDILGDILGGGRGMPGSRFAGAQSDPLSALLQGAGIGGLGGLLAGGAGGGMLGDLMRQFDQSGTGDAAKSWVSPGENIPVTPQQIEKTFGPDIINQLADQFGLDRTELLRGLSETLPDVVDQLTPDGRLPTEDEISSWK